MSSVPLMKVDRLCTVQIADERDLNILHGAQSEKTRIVALMESDRMSMLFLRKVHRVHIFEVRRAREGYRAR